MTKKCARCKTQLPSTAKFCSVCRSSEFESENQVKYTCVSCSSEIMTIKRPKFCPKCGKNMVSDDELRRDLIMRRILAPDAQLHHCGICRQDIKFGLTFCPNCKEAFHYHHLSNWVLSNSSCPLCKTKLVLGK